MSTQKRRRKRDQRKLYRIRNWPEYNESLKRRGSLEIWLPPAAQAVWYAEPTGEPGSPGVYSDTAMTCCLSIRKLFKLPLRQTQGFVRSIFSQTNTRLKSPDYTTLSRRGRFLLVKLPKNARKKKVRISVDSSGIKVTGEGEWKVKKHGAEGHRGWKKIHVVIDDDGEVRATDVTDEDTADAEVTESLLSQEEATIEWFGADGAYDKRHVYTALEQRDVTQVAIPPRSNAKIW